MHLKPTNLTLLFELFENEQYDEVINSTLQIFQLTPSILSKEILEILAGSYFYLEDFINAKLVCEALLDKYPNSLDARFYRGSIFQMESSYKAAIKEYNTCLKLETRNPIIWNERGVCHFQLQDYYNALKDFNKSCMLDNEFTAALSNRANLLYFLKEYELALKDYMCLIEKLNEDEDILIGLLNTMFQLGKYQEVLAYMEELEVSNHYSGWILGLKGDCFHSLGDKDTAINFWKMSITYKFPQRPYYVQKLKAC